VNQTRFLNTSQPQTLVIATVLLYINAFFDLLSGYGLLMLIAVALAAGGFGIANEKRWGYSLAVAAAVVKVALIAVLVGFDVLSGLNIIPFLFDVALVALLLHPMSRDYQKIWFR
jgi:hypothetical protein